MEAQEIVILAFGLFVALGGLVYLVGLLRSLEGGRMPALFLVAAVAACTIALSLANRAVWVVLALCAPSCACVMLEAYLHLR